MPNTPTADVRLFLLDPSPADWKAIEKPEEVTVLEMFDFPQDGISSITDEDLANLGRFQNVRTLQLSGESITVKGFQHVLKLKSLEAIVLFGDQIGDSEFQILRELPSLEMIGLMNTQVTKKDIDRLKKARPDVYIEIYDGSLKGQIFNGLGCLTPEFYSQYYGRKLGK